MPQTTRSSPGRSPGRPTKAESLRLRQHLLKMAAKEFLKHGYSGANIDTIAKRAKIGKMTVYRHFPSKEHLFRAVVIHISDRFQNDFAKVAQEGRPVRDVIEDFAVLSFDDPATEEMLGITRILIAEMRAFPDLVYAMYQHRREMIRPLVDYLHRMEAEGVLHFTGPAELAAFQLVALASGGIRALMIPREAIERNREAFIKAAVEVFLSGTLNTKKCRANRRGVRQKSLATS